MNQVVNQQNSNVKVRGVADIMFCIDSSGSMSSCLNGVKNHVRDFIKGLEGMNANACIDWRIGITLYSNSEIHFLDLTTDIGAFEKVLQERVSGGDEFTPGAIDYTITNASWRNVSHKVLINFTDETIKSGSCSSEPDRGVGKFDQLLNKMNDCKIQLLYYGPYCDYYDQYNMVPKAIVNKVDNFNTVNFSELLKNIAATVSQTAAQGGSGQGKVSSPSLTYNLKGMHIIKY